MGLWKIIKGEQPGIIESLLNYENAGHFGEYLTEYAINNNNLQGYLKTINNLYIPHKGKSTEIDVLMIHEKGLFVFESKNYSGWIFGSVDQQKWTQCFPNKEKHQFYNPILQNRTHINAIAVYLNLPIEDFSSFIVFSEHCELKRIPENSDNFTILKRDKLLKNIRQVLDNRAIRYTKEQVDSFAQKLETTSSADDQKKQEHIADIKSLSTGTICPLCGGNLVERKGKFGTFYGCGNYPKCRFTRNIK